MIIPEPGALVNIRSTQGQATYWNVTVIGVGESSRGMALWCEMAGPDPLRPSRVVAYIPLDEIESWRPAG